MNLKKTSAAALAFCVFGAVGASTVGFAQDVDPIAIQPLFATIPGDLGGKQMTALEATIQPGAGMPTHWHPGSVFVYVVSGQMRSQLGGEDAIVYGAGQVWYEPVDAEHAEFVNPSDSEPAKIVAVMFGDEGSELVITK